MHPTMRFIGGGYKIITYLESDTPSFLLTIQLYRDTMTRFVLSTINMQHLQAKFHAVLATQLLMHDNIY